MTEWIPVNMHPMDGMPGYFSFFCKVAKGFKYRFKFIYKDEVVLDGTRYEVSEDANC